MRLVAGKINFGPLVIVAAIGLTACGAGSGASTSSTSALTDSSASTGTTGPGASAGGSSRSTHPASEGPVDSNGSGSKAAGAAGFLRPHADNSVPSFGAEATPSQKDGATAALKSFLAARAKGDWPTACSQLEAPVVAKLETLAKASKGRLKGCAAILKALSGGSPAATRANPLGGAVVALRIKRGRGFALFYGLHGEQFVMPMTSEGDEWKLGQLAPIPYPPEAASTTPSSP